MPVFKQQQHTAKLNSHWIVNNYYRQIISKKRHVENAMDLVRRLAELTHAREHAHPRQLKDIDNSIEQIRNDLKIARATTNQRLVGCTTGPAPSADLGDWDWPDIDNAEDNPIFCNALKDVFSTQLANLSRLIRMISGGWHSRATIKTLAEDISSGRLNIWNAENHAAIADRAASVCASESRCEKNAMLPIFYCFTDANGNFSRPSSVVKLFISERRRVSTPRRKALPRNRVHAARRRQTSTHTHGSALKSGDDGDGDGGDGEPPRPRSAHSPTPPLHRSLTHSLTIAGGAQ